MQPALTPLPVPSSSGAWPLWRAAIAASPAVGLVAVGIILLTLINGFYNSMAVQLGAEWPYTSFLFRPDDRFADLIKILLSWPGPEPVGWQDWSPLFKNYYLNNPYGGVEALAAGTNTHLHGQPLGVSQALLLRQMFAVWGPWTLLLVLTGCWLVPLIGLTIGAARGTALRWLLALTVLLLYPTLMALTRGHTAAGTTNVLLIGALLLAWQRRAGWLLAIVLGLLLNYRPNTVLFLALPFLAFPFWQAVRQVAAALVIACGLFGFGYLVAHGLHPDYTLENMRAGLGIYYNLYVIGDAGLAYSSSLFGALKLMGKHLDFLSLPLHRTNLVIALSGGGVLLLSALLYLRGWLDRRAAIFLLCAVYTLVSSVFVDYYLLAFFGCLLLYAGANAPTWRELSATDQVILLSCLLLLAPKNYLFSWTGPSLQVILNPALLLFAVSFVLGAAFWRRPVAAAG